MSPFIHIPGKGDILHFHHANGFPAGVYRPLLNTLSQHYDVYALHGRATWDNSDPSHKNWRIFADDLIEFAERFEQPIIAVGHSLGASTTVLAALLRPELFKALVLIEPAMVSMPTALILKYAPKKLLQRIKLISGTLNKKDSWPSQQDYLSYIQKFPPYRQFNQATFEAFGHSAIQKNKEGHYSLVFPKHWEAHNYALPPFLLPQLKRLKRLAIPTVAIRGSDNHLFPMKLWRAWKKVQGNAVFLQDQRYSHLLPLESAEACSELITQGLGQLKFVE